MQEDNEYDQRRAAAELKMAEAARNPAAARAHHDLAKLHLERARRAVPDPADDARP